MDICHFPPPPGTFPTRPGVNLLMMPACYITPSITLSEVTMHPNTPSIWHRIFMRRIFMRRIFSRRDTDIRWRHDARRTLTNLRRRPDTHRRRTRVYSAPMPDRLTVIIPALNEAAFLPPLLDSLNAQTLAPHEIIVADAGSTDGTVAAAEARGARVVPGGMPGPGRNAGAAAATGDILLFLDADVRPGPDFIAGILREFADSDSDVATCLVTPLDGTTADHLITDAVNLYLQVMQPISPHAPGFCIIVKRSLHQQISGFDASLKMAEDHDYVQRASAHGNFAVLTSVAIPVSMRRLEKEGLVQLAFKYLWCELHALTGRPVRETPFDYQFGAFGEAAETGLTWATALVDVGALRSALGKFDNPLDTFTPPDLSRLRALATRDTWAALERRMQLPALDFDLEPPDLKVLQRYLRMRLAVIPRLRRLRARWHTLTAGVESDVREIIRWLGQ